MTYKSFKKIRLLIIALIAIIIATAVSINNFYLAISGILIGILFNFFVRIKFKKAWTDERIVNVSDKATKITYVISTLVLAILSLFFIFSGRQHQDATMETIGIVFSYIAMLNIAVYTVSFHYFNKKYGGD